MCLSLFFFLNLLALCFYIRGEYDLVGSLNCQNKALFQMRSSNIGNLPIDPTP